MRVYFIIFIMTLCSINVAIADPTDTTANGDVNSATIVNLKSQLFQYLDSGDIFVGSFDQATEIEIAKTQLKLAQSYMTEGDRKLAIILGILARKTMQRVLQNPYNPEMIPIYSILVELYSSRVDTDQPNEDKGDATKAQMYREAIDHIHAR